MTDAADVDRRPPFEGVPTRDVVRDVVACVALLVALPLPWDVLRRGSDLLWVVLTTVLALLVVAAPYGRRAGVLSDGWARLAEPRARLFGLAPYAVVAGVYLVLDAVRSVPDAGGVGTGLALGVAGAMLAAAPSGTRPLVIVSVVAAVGAVATPLIGVLDGAGWSATVSAVLAALFVVGLLWLTVKRFLDGDDAAGIVLLAVGAAVALELAVLGGAVQHVWTESLHGSRYGMLLVPLVAAAAVPSATERMAAAAGEPWQRAADRWVRVAVQVFELMMLVAAFVGLNAAVQLVAQVLDVPTHFSFVELVLRIVIGVLVVVVAFLARRALLRDPRTAHATAVGAACVVVALGVVILVARAGVGTASRVEELLLALALPAIALGVLLMPPSVRELVASRPEPVAEPLADAAAAPGYAQPAYGVASHPAVDQPQPAYGRPAYVQEVSSSQPGVGTEPVAGGSAASGHEAPAQSDDGAQGSRWRGTWAAGTDATQQLSPVTGEQAHAYAEARETGASPQVDATQMLPPVQDRPSGRWSADVALDPTTPLEDLATIVQEAPHLRPHVAANPSTYPALLDWLGALGDPAVDAALRSRR